VLDFFVIWKLLSFFLFCQVKVSGLTTWFLVFNIIERLLENTTAFFFDVGKLDQPQKNEKMAEFNLDCRICADNEETDETGRLFRPCLCRGNLVHEACLERWRATSLAHACKCEVCHYEYRVSRQRFAKMMLHPCFITLCTVLVVVLTVVTVALLIRFFAWTLFGVVFTGRALAVPIRLAWYSVLVIGAMFLMFVVLASFFGDNNGNGNGNFSVLDIFRFVDFDFVSHSTLSTILSWTGYTVSCTGFAMFIGAVYQVVRLVVLNLLTNASNRVLEVQIQV